MNKRNRLLMLAGLVPLLSLQMAMADVLILKSGIAITGKFQGGDPSGITMQVNGQYHRYTLSEVQSLTIVQGGESSIVSSAPAPSAPAPASQAPSYSTGRAPAPSTPAPVASTTPAPSSTSSGGLQTRSTTTPTATSGVTVPAGTLLVVRMIDTVDSSVHQTGEMFRASLDEPLVLNGRTIAPRGADVTTKLVAVEEAGKLSGRSELALVLFDVTIDGRRREITTGEVYEAGASRGQQSAKRIGGLAVVGAVIGAIAGGGKGAAQGAAAGAGAGTAIQVLTSGDKVQVPAESRLEFTLAAPLVL